MAHPWIPAACNTSTCDTKPQRSRDWKAPVDHSIDQGRHLERKEGAMLRNGALTHAVVSAANERLAPGYRYGVPCANPSSPMRMEHSSIQVTADRHGHRHPGQIADADARDRLLRGRNRCYS